MEKALAHTAFMIFALKFEYGITDKLTVGVKLILFDHTYSGIEAGNDPVHETQTANGGSFNKTQYVWF